MGVAERRERERKLRRERIVESAEREFARVGPLTVTMDDVAREAELSKGTLYLYFPSKDHLYMAIARRGLERIVVAMEEAVVDGERAAAPGLSLLERAARASNRVGIEHPSHLQTMLAWMASGFRASPGTSGYDEYQATVSRLMKLVTGLVERGRADGSIRQDVDPVQTVLQLWGGSMGMWLLHLNRDEVSKRVSAPGDFDSLVPSYIDLLLRAIRGDRGGAEALPAARNGRAGACKEETRGDS